MAEKVALLMSGGVDSSYCAYLLQQSGYDVEGIYLKLHDKEKKHEINIQNIQKVCEKLNIKYKQIDAREEFKKCVYDEFINSYLKGLTPNPCAICNPQMKFGLALDIALKDGAKYIATGHYARIKEIDGIKRIEKAVDDTKDQSYFLYAISQDAIDRLLFPLGDKQKIDIKKEALDILPFLGTLETYKESQEICFVDDTYLEILRQAKQTKDIIDIPGIVRNTKGEKIGTHKGYMHYTIGKRKGFDVPGAFAAHFVLDIDASSNEIIVGQKDELSVTQIKATNKSLVDNFKDGIYSIKIRYKSIPAKAEIKLKDGIIYANMIESVSGVAKGQALVVYKEDCILGGGEII